MTIQSVEFIPPEDLYYPTIRYLKHGGFLVASNAMGIRTIALYNDDGTSRGKSLTFSDPVSQLTELANSNILASWQTQQFDDETQSFFEMNHTQIINMSGETVGDEIVVENHDAWQIPPTITSLADGGWITTTLIDSSADSTNELEQQAYYADGSKRGDMVIQVLGSSSFRSYDYKTIALPDGGWTAIWQTYSARTKYDVCQQVFNADGSARTEAERINSVTDGVQSISQVFALDDGGWIATLLSENRDVQYGCDVFEQSYNSDGSLRSEEIKHSASQAYPTPVVRIAALDDGGWIELARGGPAPNSEVIQRIFDAQGNQVGSNQQLTAPGKGNLTVGDVTMLANGGWVLDWQFNDYPGGRLYQQAFDADGSVRGPAQRLDRFYGRTMGAETAALDDGGWVSAWTTVDFDKFSASTTYTLNMELFSADGKRGQAFYNIDQAVGWYDYSNFLSITSLTTNGDKWALSWKTGADTIVSRSLIFDLESGAPSGTDGTVHMVEGHTHTFRAHDFGFTDYGPGETANNNFTSVIITAVPYPGKLLLDGIQIEQDQEIAVSDIGTLTWRPPKNFYGSVGIQFQVTDDGGAENNGQDTDPSPKTLTIAVKDVPERRIGTNQSETLVGTYDADILIGKRGDDTLKGLEGSDVFVFRTGDGHDKITGFTVKSYDGSLRMSHYDSIDLSEMASIRNFHDLIDHHLSFHKFGFLIDAGHGDTIDVHTDGRHVSESMLRAQFDF